MDERRIELALRAGPPFASGYQPRTLELEPVAEPAAVRRLAWNQATVTVAAVAVLLVLAWLGSLAVKYIGTDEPIPAPSMSASAESQPTPAPESLSWTGPVREANGAVVPLTRVPDWLRYDSEPVEDAGSAWIEIASVRRSDSGQTQWYIDLATLPPPTDTLDPAETVISYGLVFDTDGDGNADYELGISNVAPSGASVAPEGPPGEGTYRVWVTDLATGETDEQIGPPYGFPVEFRHPDVLHDPELFPGEGPSVMFTFLTGSAPDDLERSVRFYAWASLTQGGEVIAWDYAPDSTWLVVPELAPEL